MKTRIDDFVSALPFPLDPFQTEAIAHVDAGDSVLVAAPTGSGKTVVAEYACWHALETGGKCFYTTPLKALSNQKFGDLVAQHGAKSVGLLTGDNSINGEAPIVVMTTEVLRNMLYEKSHALYGLRWVVMDEVHYLQDPYRGAVWEEVLIHLPEEVRVVCLSATVSNVDEFGAWLETLRGQTHVILETKRPVELRNLVLVGDELYPLLQDSGRVGNELQRVWAKGVQASMHRGPGRPHRGGPKSSFKASRVEVAKVLEREHMLPGICFIFSRAGCDDAVDQCTRAGLNLTTQQESDRIGEYAELRAATIDPEDLRALRFSAFRDGLERGIASHHAGMLPIFKEAVEELFALGLVKLVFATETLSLGINMPARSVVIERLTKFTGEKHEMLTPIDYTQLTGRAGRRGMDDLGFGITLFDPWVHVDKIGRLATQQNYTLKSSFRPSYNMAVNLVRNYDHETATHLLNSSFAQFATDRNVVRWERELERKQKEATELESSLQCELGDVMEYWTLREKAAEAMSDRRGSDEVRRAITKLVPGDVVWGDGVGRAVILEQAKEQGGAPRITAMTADRKLRRLGPRDFRQPPVAVGKITLRGQSWRSPKHRKALARELESVARKRPPSRATNAQVAKLVDTYEHHPVHGCPDLSDHLKAAKKYADVSDEVSKLKRQVRRRKGTIARTFERVLSVLRTLGYIGEWELTDKGELLTRVYNEADLLVVEALTRGWFDGLDPDELAAVASMFVYETRRRDEDEDPPTQALARHARRIIDLYGSINAAEHEQDIELVKEPDTGFMARIYEWSSGRSLEAVLNDRETSAGDFVRSSKQVIDLLQQLRQIIREGPIADTLAQSVERIQRGVVAYSSVV